MAVIYDCRRHNILTRRENLTANHFFKDRPVEETSSRDFRNMNLANTSRAKKKRYLTYKSLFCNFHGKICKNTSSVIDTDNKFVLKKLEKVNKNSVLACRHCL